LQVEHPVCCRDSPAFYFYATLTRVLGPTLIRDEVIQMRESRQKRLLAPAWVVKPFHGKQFPRDGVVGLIQQGARHRHLRVRKDGIPARLLVLKPAPDALSIGRPCRGGDVVGKAAEPLSQRKYAQALALPRPIPQRMELRA
jgi:hypothetical protein